MFAFVYAKNIIRPLPLYILRIKKKRPFFFLAEREGKEKEAIGVGQSGKF